MFHRLDGVVEGVLCGDDHRRHLERTRLGALDHLETGLPRHPDVHEGDVEGLLRECLPRGVAVLDLDDFVSLLLERLAEYEADRRLVVRHQNPRAASTHVRLRRGKATRARVPRGSRGLSWREPPCLAMK